MKVTKVTDNNYTLYQNGDDYILNLGTIRRGDDTTTELLFEDVEDIKKLAINSTCGCTSVDRNEINKNTLSVKVKYKDCDSAFTKVMSCSNNNRPFLIKVTGLCR